MNETAVSERPVKVISDSELAEWGELLSSPKKRSDGRLIRAHKVRIYPTPTQERYLLDCVHVARYAYNRGLGLWQEMRAETGNANIAKVKKTFNAEKAERSPWVSKVSRCVAKNALNDLGDAFKRFFNGQTRYPKFKKRKGKNKKIVRSFRADNGPGTFKVLTEGNTSKPRLRIRLPRCIRRDQFGLIKMAEPLRWEGELRSLTVSHDATGRWFASIRMLVAPDLINKPEGEKQAAGGVDVGVRHLVAEPDGTLHANPRALEQCHKQRRRVQRQMARRTQGSKGWVKAKVRVARIETRAADIRRDATHKATRKVADRYELLGVETLNVAGMMRNRRVAARLQDANMSETRRQLIYKTQYADGTVVLADRWFPSSKRCADCGSVNKKLREEEHWTCPCCGAEHQRDANSACNLQHVAESVKQVGRVAPKLTRGESTALPVAERSATEATRLVEPRIADN